MCKRLPLSNWTSLFDFLIYKLINARQLDIDSKESKYPWGVFQVDISLGVWINCVTNTLLYRMEIS
jgi:hypothetical protein